MAGAWRARRLIRWQCNHGWALCKNEMGRIFWPLTLGRNHGLIYLNKNSDKICSGLGGLFHG